MPYLSDGQVEQSSVDELNWFSHKKEVLPVSVRRQNTIRNITEIKTKVHVYLHVLICCYKFR